MANNILTIADGDYGYPTSTIATLVQGQYGQSLPLEIRDLAGNVVNLTGFSTLSAIKSSERGRVTSIVGTIALSGTPTVAPQLSWLLTEADTGVAGTFSLVLSVSNGTVTHETHPVELVILPNPAINAVAAPGVVGITTAQRTLLAAIQGLTGLVKMAAGSATGVAIQSFMQTFLQSATAIAARLNLLPSYTGNTGKVLAVNGAETDVEWVAQSGGGGAVDSVFGRTGAVVAASGDYGTNEISDDSIYAKASLTGALDSIANDFGGLDGNVSTHTGATTTVHGITDTAALLTNSAIGSTVQAYSAKTAAIAALTWAANSIILLTGTATASVQALASHVITFLQSANAAAARTAIGAGTGNGDLLAANNLSEVTASTARTNLALGTLSTQSGTFSGSGTLATGGFTLTVPASGTASLLGTYQTYSAAKLFAPGGGLTPIELLGTNSTTSSVHIVMQAGNNIGGTPVAGFGGSINLVMKSSTTYGTQAGRLVWLWNTATHASRVPDGVFYLTDPSAEREIWRGRATGSAAAIGFLGATPVARAAHIADAAGDDAATVNAILVVLENLGFIATS